MTSVLVEDKDIDAIFADDLDSLLGRKENQRLDFKREIGSGDNNNRELARDLCSFANADGGYMIIGAEEDGQGCCKDLPGVSDAIGLTQRVRQVALDLIQERIPNLQTKVIPSSADDIVLIYIPPSFKKPHMVVKDRKTEFWKRYETDKRTMTIEEIKNDFIQSSHLGTREIIKGKVTQLQDFFLNNQHVEKQRELAKDHSRLNEITEPQVLIEALDKHFEKTVKESRYLRLTITPHDLIRNRVEPGFDWLNDFFFHPPRQRRNGWTMETGDIIHFNTLGLHAGWLEFRFIMLTRSGHLEFWCPIKESFCLNQGKENIDEHPRLNPYPVTEFPVSFLRFSKTLYEKLSLSCSFTFRMIYWNFKGSKLGPSHPQDSQFIFPLIPLQPYSEKHFTREVILTNDFNPDGAALEIISELYYQFGYSKKHIPFFDANGSYLLND